jgi:hypothetical protein
MKTKLIVLFALLFLPLSLHAELAGWQKEFDALLKKYVSPAGVKYAAWKANAADVAAIDKVVAAIAADSPANLGKNDKLAFYINAYNAWIIDLVLKKYPMGSVRDYAPLFGIFTSKNIQIGGEKMSFNHLEKDVVIKGLGDARAHFALNCASRSCPSLMASAYDGATIDKVLDQRTKLYMASSLGIATTRNPKLVRVSMIFKWYDDDFAKAAGSTLAFINKYRTKPLPADAKLEFMEYDWNLNDAQ